MLKCKHPAFKEEDEWRIVRIIVGIQSGQVKFRTLLGTLPADCIADCAHSGPCDDDVKQWREQLEFQVPRERATAYLREFGAWTAEELAAKSDEDLAELVLWLACCQVRETGKWWGLVI